LIKKTIPNLPLGSVPLIKIGEGVQKVSFGHPLHIQLFHPKINNCYFIQIRPEDFTKFLVRRMDDVIVAVFVGCKG
jgi:hypothetical protein